MKSIITVFFSFLFIILFLSLWGFYFAVRPLKLVSTNTPKTFNLAYQDVSFITEDRIKIKGWFIPAARTSAKTIILLHGYPADKGNILASRLFLHKNYNLLLFDFRYFGQSGGHYSTLGKNEVLDLLAAISYLHTKNIHKVGVWGLSLGASVALMALPRTSEIKALVAESAYARLDWLAYEYFNIPLLRYPLTELGRLWGKLFLQIDIKSISPVSIVQDSTVPILIIHSRQDEVVSFQHALALKEALNNNPHLEVIFMEKNYHGRIDESYQKIIEPFFNKYLH